jgi:hypothetical protein
VVVVLAGVSACFVFVHGFAVHRGSLIDWCHRMRFPAGHQEPPGQRQPSGASPHQARGQGTESSHWHVPVLPQGTACGGWCRGSVLCPRDV